MTVGKDFKIIRKKRRPGRRALGKAVGVVVIGALLAGARQNFTMLLVALWLASHFCRRRKER